MVSRIDNVSNVQIDGSNPTGCEARSTRPVKEMPILDLVNADGLSKNNGYNTQIAPENNWYHGSESRAVYSETVVTGPRMNSFSSDVDLNSNLISTTSNTHSSTNDGVQIGNGMSPPFDFSGSEQLRLNKKLGAALQRMERIQGRINSLESQFQNINKCIVADTSTSKNVKQPAEPEPIVKEWHESLPLDLREAIVFRLSKTFFPTTAKIDDRVRIRVVNITRKIEKQIFDAANSKDHYLRLMRDKVLQIRKETEIRSQKRKLLDPNVSAKQRKQS